MMRAVRVIDGLPTFVDAPEPEGGGVVVDIVASSICGSDLHLIDGGIAEGRILGHEFAGRAPDGTAVAVEPLGWCGSCANCEAGSWNHCTGGVTAYGVFADGGMAERIVVPEASLVPLAAGIDPSTASLVEPLAVAVHGVRRARTAPTDRVAVIGAGPIGLAIAAVCKAEGIVADVAARHDHQRAAVERLGGSVLMDDPGSYDVVFDAVGSSESLAASIGAARTEGRVGLVGSLWGPTQIDMGVCMKEVEIIPSMMYGRSVLGRDFERAVEVLAGEPAIADTLITHRFPLDAAPEAFAVARDRAAGAIKVVFEPAD
jgi:threonine dehydrogenase-like Zn-dependent dehydrogenase